MYFYNINDLFDNLKIGSKIKYIPKVNFECNEILKEDVIISTKLTEKQIGLYYDKYIEVNCKDINFRIGAKTYYDHFYVYNHSIPGTSIYFENIKYWIPDGEEY